MGAGLLGDRTEKQIQLARQTEITLKNIFQVNALRFRSYAATAVTSCFQDISFCCSGVVQDVNIDYLFSSTGLDEITTTSHLAAVLFYWRASLRCHILVSAVAFLVFSRIKHDCSSWLASVATAGLGADHWRWALVCISEVDFECTDKFWVCRLLICNSSSF